MFLATADSHPLWGFTCKYCQKNHEFQYYDVLQCVDKQAAKFVEEVKKMPIYENTTILFIGDHPTNYPQLHKNYKPNGYMRTVFNLLVNPYKKPSQEITNKRTFLSFDWFPTILGAVGVKIKGNRIAFGTDLFSGQKTLAKI